MHHTSTGRQLRRHPLPPNLRIPNWSQSVFRQNRRPRSARTAIMPRLQRKPWVFRVLQLAAYSAALISLTWFIAVRSSNSHQTRKAADPIWASLFDGKRNTYIVPADMGLNLLEDLSHRPMALADYMKGGYLELPVPGVDRISAEGLRSQRLTSFVDAQIISTVAGLPEYNPAADLPSLPARPAAGRSKGRQRCSHRIGGQ